MIHKIHSFVLDDEKLRAVQARLQPLLDEIDALRDPAQDGKTMLSDWVTLRMQRYANRLADEFKARKDKDRIVAFTSVVADINAHVVPLLEKDQITWSDLGVLHTKLYPKGLFGQAKNNRGETMLVKFPTSVFREREDFVRMSEGDIYFLSHEHIPEVLRLADEFLNASPDLHFLIRLIIFLALTSYAHPYYNGNGTVLYFYMGLLLIRAGYPIPFAVDAYFTSQRIGDDLRSCSDGSNYDTIIELFLRSFLDTKIP